MEKLPGGFDFDGVYCFSRSSDPHTFYYLPGAPTPQLGPRGDPSVSLISAGSISMLQVASQWVATPDQLAGVQSALSRQLGPDTAVQLQPVGTSVEAVTLEVANPQSGWDSLASANSSGLPPYQAIFSVQLAGEQGGEATSAISGEPAKLRLVYHATAQVPASIALRLHGDLTDVVNGLASDATLEDCRSAVVAALVSKQLEEDIAADSDLPASTLETARTELIDMAADSLRRMTSESQSDVDIAHFHVESQKTLTFPVSVERSADIADWFSGGRGRGHIQVAGN